MNAVFDELKRVCEKLAASEAEIATLKESRAVAVEQEQASRNKANRLREKCARFQKALEQLARLGNEPMPGNSIGNRIAQDALREP